MTKEKKDEIKKKKNGRSIDWEVDMKVCYVPLPPERVAGWHAATLLLFENFVFPALHAKSGVEPAITCGTDDIPEI